MLCGRGGNAALSGVVSYDVVECMCRPPREPAGERPAANGAMAAAGVEMRGRGSRAPAVLSRRKTVGKAPERMTSAGSERK
ncbi:hypothetical protein Sfum_1660 [Syntrophobacter fumaroxidans MPOB]|uniref:Uncharacterized protein n=1 Tax=Syntrophobacter fumaroxidans (strain DSM 10017 / MPOB) TaxID=335543 RepID=A0LIU5_SYNFM|nr:hypothetical protein Sfum_1660 [Syntrophobacter fumaroxidans MPOB]